MPISLCSFFNSIYKRKMCMRPTILQQSDLAPSSGMSEERTLRERFRRWVTVNKVLQKLFTVLWVPGFTKRKRWQFLKRSLRGTIGLLAVTVGFFTLQVFREGREFSGALPTLWVLATLLLVLGGLLIPYGVRWLTDRVEHFPGFFPKHGTVYGAAATVPTLVLGPSLFLFYLFGSGDPVLGPHVPALCLYLAIGFLLLNGLAVVVMAKELSIRMGDSLRVISNGMEMIAKLDFEHPIATLAEDEIGQLANVFSETTQILKTRVSVLNALFNNIRIFSGMLNEEKILEHAVKTFKSLEEPAEVTIALWDEDEGKMVVKASFQKRPEALGLGFSEGKGVMGKILADPQILPYWGGEYSRLANECPEEKTLWGKSTFVLGIPMIFKGRVKGAVVIYDVNYGAFQLEAKKDYLQGLANQIAIFLENARLYGMVIRDRLTGLYVHSFIEAELENLLAQARRYNFPVTFIMLDVDKFKQVNDTYGHMTGNKLLKAVAEKIKVVSRDSDLVARYGGDEFEIVLPHTDKEGALVYAEKLLKSVREMEMEVSPGVMAKVTLSIGMASYPKDADNVAHLQAAADSALYGAKALGRNCIMLYETAQK